MIRLLHGDCREVLRTLPDASVHCCVTSPPYFGLRSYLPADHPDKAREIGMEQTPAEFVAAMVEVFREVRRVLRDDGTLWLNLGDSYANDSKWGGATSGKHVQAVHGASGIGRRRVQTGYKSKELMGIPWQVAFALSADGWWLRQDIIWHKPNPMPESVRDRCTKAHEYLFLLSKSERYYFDSEAMQEPATGQIAGNIKPTKGVEHDPEKHRTRAGLHAFAERQRSRRDSFKRDESKRSQAIPGQTVGTHRPYRADSEYDVEKRNRRSVWTVPTLPFSGAHFAVYPPDLVRPCITAGCPEGGTVLDPFGGSGTTGLVADQHGRNAILIDLDERNLPMARERIAADAPLFAEVTA